MGSTSNTLLLAQSTSAAAPLLVPGPSFPPGTCAPISMFPGAPVVFSGAPGAPGTLSAPCRVLGHHITALAGAPWHSQATPYASEFMAPPTWPMYVPSYMPRPPAQQALMQAEFEELARQCQDLEVRELEVQRMTRTRNLNAMRDARVTATTSVAGSRHSCNKEQAPRLYLRDP